MHEAVDRGAHLVQIGEIAVDRRETDIGDEVEIVQPLDDQFADRRTGHLALAEIEEGALDIGDERIDRTLTDRALDGAMRTALRNLLGSYSSRRPSFLTT